MKRIKLGGHMGVAFLHAHCADRYLAALADPPVSAQFADSEVAKGRPDDPVNPDGWSFNDDDAGSRGPGS